ncbi:hypothetical protein [Ramlibacter sp. PS4R-6]|uniref:hypothetical protein n=1 Tax=Ramlibacter sp. PS4R-6 TaxID=3133438 RepID=UPI0030B11009
MQRTFLRAATAAAAIALLNSCASLVPFTPDMGAKAPRLEGYGQLSAPITTSSPEAQALFNEGVLQAYAFNETAAVRAFKAALAKDRGCAMCAWGVAWQLGPGINSHSRDGAAEALKYVDYALRRLDRATPREKALVESLALRYAHATAARETAPLMAAWCGKTEKDDNAVHPLDDAYAAAMRKLADAYPADPEILTLYAEAELIATPGDALWDKDGRPAGRAGEVADRLEKLLASHPRHTGLNHYLIHTVDAASVAKRAVAAADRLGQLAPASPHLVHMPAHIYINVGRFEEATRVNQAALAGDEALVKLEKAQGFEPSKDWRGHNSHFLWYAAIVSGNEKVALDAAAGVAEIGKDWDNNFGEYLRSTRLFTLLRFERWDQALAEPQPKGERGVTKAHWLFARGVAQARLGRVDEAVKLLDELKPVAEGVRTRNAKRKATVAMMEYDVARLESEIALARGDLDAAIAAQAKVAEFDAVLEQSEPPFLGSLGRTTLGDLQARAKRIREAEASYRQVLAERPGHPLAEKGLKALRQ